jgi:hypothetical protein
MLEKSDKYKNDQCPTSQECGGDNLSYRREVEPVEKTKRMA